MQSLLGQVTTRLGHLLKLRQRILGLQVQKIFFLLTDIGVAQRLALQVCGVNILQMVRTANMEK
jgi:hypothetical protein